MVTKTRAHNPKANGKTDTHHFELSAKQYAFVYDDEHKFPAFIGGLGSGKSYAGALKALRKVIEHPGSLGVVGAPNYPQLRDSTMRTVFEIFPPELIADFNKNEMRVSLINGSEVLLRSMDKPDNLRGPNLLWFWLDEGPLCGYYAWQVMKGRLRAAIDGQGVQGWITGTPHGQDKFYDDFEAEPKPGHMLYRGSTRDNATNLPPGYIEDMGYTGQFALQEIEGLFVRFEGLVYDFITEWHVGEWPGPGSDGNPRPVRMRIGGVDWGYTNPSVALPIWLDYDLRAYVRDEFYARQSGFAGVAKACVEFSKEYGITTWYCGPDEPEHIAGLNAIFADEHVNAKAVAADDDINAGLSTVRKLMTLRGDQTVGLKVSAKCTYTKSEFRTYSYPDKRPTAQNDPQEKPLKANDHALDALRYALHSTLGILARRGAQPKPEIHLAIVPRSDFGGGSLRDKTF